MTELKDDLDMEPYFRAWEEQKKAVENMPLPEVDLKKLRKWYRRSPRQKLLRREVACLIAAVVILVWLLFNFSKGMEMPVAYIMTLLLMLLCVADSVYALRLIALANPITSTIPDMLKNCARLRLYEKIEMLSALVVVVPMTLFFYIPVLFWILQSANYYTERNQYMLQIVVIVLLDFVFCLYFYRSNLRLIKKSIKEIREYKH